MSTEKSRPSASILNKVLQVVKQATQKKASGELRLQRGGRQWFIAFHKGKVVYATDNHHRVRRWQRVVRQHEVQFVPNDGISPQVSLWEYHWLSLGVEAGGIAIATAQTMIETALWEVLVVAAGYTDVALTWHKVTPEERQQLNQGGDLHLPLKDLEPLAKRVLKVHQRLQALDISIDCLDLAPVFKDADWGKKPGSSENTTYIGLVPLLNGRRTMLDVMVTMRQPLPIVAHIMRHLIRKDAVEFCPIGDRPLANLPPFAPGAQSQLEAQSQGTSAASTASPTSLSTVQPPDSQPISPSQAVATVDDMAKKSSNEIPLVACVDDSPQVCALMGSIVQQAGYRYVSTQDSVKAVSLLLQEQPDLIFLDLIMPIVNGYEVCKQLRRVKRFKTVPIAILTGNDGAIDRVRAKVVGASDFIAKPIQAERIVAALRKYFAKSKVPVNRASKAAHQASGVQVKMSPTAAMGPVEALRELGSPLGRLNGKAAPG
ncbi:MAG: response regulator [Cyanobacteria bacterium P01_F01_bin.153]